MLAFFADSQHDRFLRQGEEFPPSPSLSLCLWCWIDHISTVPPRATVSPESRSPRLENGPIFSSRDFFHLVRKFNFNSNNETMNSRYVAYRHVTKGRCRVLPSPSLPLDREDYTQVVVKLYAFKSLRNNPDEILRIPPPFRSSPPRPFFARYQQYGPLLLPPPATFFSGSNPESSEARPVRATINLASFNALQPARSSLLFTGLNLPFPSLPLPSPPFPSLRPVSSRLSSRLVSSLPLSPPPSFHPLP